MDNSSPTLTALTSKTFVGTLITVFGFISSPAVLAFLPKNWSAIIGGVGALLGMFGLRQAVAKVATTATAAAASANAAANNAAAVVRAVTPPTGSPSVVASNPRPFG